MATVLIVDDDTFARSVLEAIFAQAPELAGQELEVLCAADGEEGVALARAHRPNVVVVDLLMPKKDGFAVCKEIRAELGAAVHLVVISGIYRESAITQRLRTEHDAVFFAKPYQLKDMVRHVAALIPADGRERAGSEGDAPQVEIVAESLAGELSSRPLPAVLFDLVEARQSGTLTVSRNRVIKKVELSFGHPVSASSSLREETLGPRLVAAGVITDVQQRRAVERASAQGQRLGQILIGMGLLTPEQLVDHLTAQIRHRVVRMLRWTDGTWSFEPSDQAPRGARGNAIDSEQLVLHGLAQTASFDATPATVARLGRRPLSLTPRGQRLLPLCARLFCPALTAAWRDGVTVESLLEVGLERAPLWGALDALVATGGLLTDAGDDSGALLDAAPEELDVYGLSEHSQVSRLPRPPGPDGSDLYATLFDEATGVPTQVGSTPLDAAPEELDVADSGVIDVRALGAADRPRNDDASARRKLLEEYLRIQDRTHYQVLRVDPGADAVAISTAVAERRSKFSMDWFARFDLGRDYAKLEEIHAAYDRAFQVLLDDARRAVYDAELTGIALTQHAPSLDAEMAYRAGEELLDRGQYGEAIRRLTTAVEAAPDEAEYHALLGWAQFLQGGRSARAADVARPHLNQALAINPDHAAAHQYKGVISATLGTDDVEATLHLERALDTDPTRAEALAALVEVWTRRGEHRPLERQYRRLIYRMAGDDPRLELKLWLELAELYRFKLDDRTSARVAYASAAKLAPSDRAIAAALADVDSGSPDRFYERSEVLRTHWRRDPAQPGPGLELLRAAHQAQRPDAAFMAASALVARGMADDEALELCRRYRPRFVVRAQRPLDPELWPRLRHPDDDHELVALFDLLAPAVARAAPLTLSELELDDTMEVAEADLPPALVRVRAYVAHMLAVPVPTVYVRPDFGHQIHVGALQPPVLLAGDGALVEPERTELGFRLGRAMTYLWPGRTIGGSRPPRLLKQCVLAALQASVPGAQADDPDGVIATVRAAIEELPAEVRGRIADVVVQLTRRDASLNLSRWTHGLARTADRVGLLLCGDLPAAVRFARDSGSGDAAEDLIDFALSGSHLMLRAELGLSIDV